jgi:hypothetical protein
LGTGETENYDLWNELVILFPKWRRAGKSGHFGIGCSAAGGKKINKIQHGGFKFSILFNFPH